MARFVEPIFNTGQFLTFLASVVGLALWLRFATPQERDVLANQWANAIEAFAIAVFVWAFVSLVSAPFLVIRDDRKRGTWIGPRRLYFQPVLANVSVWTPDDQDKCVPVSFDDSECGALVRYKVELDPAVPGRASAYLERYPGEMDGVLNSIMGPSGVPAKMGGSGSIGTVKRDAYLRVRLDPGTVPVTARVYVTDFTLGDLVI
jgi:hypothetical protein